MKLEIPDEFSCSNCIKQKVCKFYKPLRDSVYSILSEIGNWKDRKNTMNTIEAIVAVNCSQFNNPCEECARSDEVHG